MPQRYSICVVGSSHTAALINAWKGMPEAAPGVSITFFAGVGRTLGMLAWQDGAFVPEGEESRGLFVASSGGKERIVPADYDAVVLNGFGLRFAEDVVDFARNYGTMDQAQFGAPPPRLLSSDCFGQAIEQMFARSAIFRCLGQIRSVFGGPMVVCPAPYLPRGIFRDTFQDTPRCNDPDLLQSLVLVFQRTVARLCAQYDAEPIWQDESTIEPPCFTIESFGLGSSTLRGKERHGVNKHMNEEFGAIALRRILARLDELSQGRVLGSNAETVVPLRKLG